MKSPNPKTELRKCYRLSLPLCGRFSSCQANKKRDPKWDPVFFRLNRSSVYRRRSAERTSSSSFLMKRFAKNRHTASTTIMMIKGTMLKVNV